MVEMLSSYWQCKQKQSQIIAQCSIPPYGLKSIGSRHFLLAGGGGAAKTGVANEIDLYLLTYDNDISLLESQPIASRLRKLVAKHTGIIDTTTFANMNMDVIALNAAEPERYLIAAGQDQYCSLYEVTGFSLLGGADSNESNRSFSFRALGKFETDEGVRDPYQKCVKLYRSKGLLWMATGGSDGKIRIWNVSWILARNECLPQESGVSNIKAELEINTGKEMVDDLDVSPCGSVLATVGRKETSLYDTLNGTRLVVLGEPMELQSELKVRALRFIAPEDGTIQFVVAYNQRVRAAKELSYLAFWRYNKDRKQCQLVSVKRACNETISCLAVSSCSNYTSIGTMNGSVGIFDSSGRSLLFSSKAHSSFVTSVEFLQDDASEKNFFPSAASVISSSIDQTVRLHSAENQSSSSMRGFLLKMAVSGLVIYVLICLVFKYQRA